MSTYQANLMSIKLESGTLHVLKTVEGGLAAYMPESNRALFVDVELDNVFGAALDARRALLEEYQTKAIALIRYLTSHNRLVGTSDEMVAQLRSRLTNSERDALKLPALPTAQTPASLHVRMRSHLENNVVVLVFRKQGDGSVRTMVATRNPAIIQQQAPGIQEPVRRGRAGTNPSHIPVFDLERGEYRSFLADTVFRMDTLPEYVKHADMESKSIDGLAWFNLPLNAELRPLLAEGGGGVEAFVTHNLGAPLVSLTTTAMVAHPYAPDAYTIKNMADILQTKVVRIVFEKKDGGVRIMFATRNAALIQSYEKLGKVDVEETDDRSAEEKVNEMVERGVIKVFDLGIQEFRAFTVQNLLAFDEANNVPSWIEYDIDTGDWFATLRGTKSVTDTYSGTRFAGKDLVTIDKDRLKFEAQQYKYQIVKSMTVAENQQDTSHLERLRVAEAIKNEAVAASKTAGFTSQDLEVNAQFVAFFKRLEDSFEEKMVAGNINPAMILSGINVSKITNLITVTLNWGRDVFYIHPHFIVGATSNKVYADRTGKFEALDRAKLSNADKAFEPILEQLAPYVTARRRADIFTKPVEGDDVRRVTRIAQLVKTYAPQLKEQGITISRTKGLPAQFKATINRKQFAIFNHEYVYNLASKQFEFIRTKETTYANTLDPYVTSLENPLERTVLELLQLATDLRRAVKNDAGEQM